MSATTEVHEIDQAYTGFQSFDDWRSVYVDNTRWKALKARIDELSNSNDVHLKRALQIARRAAAFESGAVEELYPTDRGITMTIAKETAEWEEAVNATGRPEIVHDQLDAYEGLLDLVTQKVPITEAGIRELHTRLCKSQKTYLVHTPAGPQKQQFIHGKYKTHPNHVLKADGTYHAYAPVDMVAPEMQRLCVELARDEFSSAHAVIQAAYSHHALAMIHPFPDGNGRVVRAVASVFLYRNARIPFLFFLDQKSDYFDALARADNKQYQQWVDFVYESGLQTMLLVEQTFQSALAPAVAESLESIDSLYVTKSGYTHEEIDLGAQGLLEVVMEALTERLPEALRGSAIKSRVSGNQETHPAPSGYRNLLTGQRSIVVHVVNERPPASATHGIAISVFVPKDADAKDPVILWHHQKKSVVFEARVDELIPRTSTSVDIRARAFVDGLVGIMLHHLMLAAQHAASKA